MSLRFRLSVTAQLSAVGLSQPGVPQPAAPRTPSQHLPSLAGGRMSLRRLASGLFPAVYAAVPTDNKSAEPQRPSPIRPSDLPIYTAPHAEYVSTQRSKESAAKQGESAQTVLEPPIKAVRVQIQEALKQTDNLKHTVSEAYNDVETKTSWIVKYLREEENKDQRYGAVAMGGLTGLVLGVRGGIFKKLFYTAIGTGIMGFACFPEQSDEIAREAIASGRHYMNVAYNFCYGVKPGDPQLEIKFPELNFPKDLSEFVDLSVNLASTVKQAIMPPPNKDDQEKPKSS